MYGDSEGWGSTILKLLVCFLLIIILTFGSRACSRSDRNMVFIKDGYCYDRDTHIIYIESYTGRYGDDTAYTPYYDANGDLCKYNISTGEWVPINKTQGESE